MRGRCSARGQISIGPVWAVTTETWQACITLLAGKWLYLKNITSLVLILKRPYVIAIYNIVLFTVSELTHTNEGFCVVEL